MERTRSPTTYRGVRRDLLLRLAEPAVLYGSGNLLLDESGDGYDPASSLEDEERMWNLSSAMHNVLDRCEETMRRTGRPILCWLITTKPSPCFPKPFKFLAREQTRRSYRRWLKGFIAFVFRAWRMDPCTRSSLTGIRFSQRQSGRLRLI